MAALMQHGGYGDGSVVAESFNSFRRLIPETINNDIITRPITSTLSHSVINKITATIITYSYPLISSHMPGCVFLLVFIIGCQIMFRSCSNRIALMVPYIFVD
jgi:hypothetical protein